MNKRELAKVIAKLEGMVGAKSLSDEDKAKLLDRHRAKGATVPPTNGGASASEARERDYQARKTGAILLERAEDARLMGAAATQTQRDARWKLQRDEAEFKRLSERPAKPSPNSPTLKERVVNRQMATEEIHARRNARLGSGPVAQSDKRQAELESQIAELKAKLQGMGVDVDAIFK